jgi:dolichol-phosphate mannosyltransferase
VRRRAGCNPDRKADQNAHRKVPLRIRDYSGRLPPLKKQIVPDDAVGSIALPANFARVRWRQLAWALVVVVVCLRVLYAAQVELLPEETYYWNYSRHLDIGYLDHPPMVAWLIRGGTLLFGSTELGVRCGALCCGAVAALFLCRLTLNLVGEGYGLATLVFSMALPYFFMSGVLMTPDAPLTAAWAASLYFLERALIAGRPRAWLGAGLAMGLGLLSKYTIGLLGLATVLFMLVDAPSRRWFRRWEPYAAVLLTACVFMPVIVWNAEHHWASFVFQTARRLAEAPRFSLQRLIGAAALLLTPTGLLAAGFFFFGGWARGRGIRYLQFAVAIPVGVFMAFSLRHDVKLDWTGAPWTAALPLIATGLFESAVTPGGMARWLRTAWPPTLIGLLALYAVGWIYLVFGIPAVGYSEHTELLPVGWRDFAHQVDGLADEVRARLGNRLLIVGMDRYAIASELTFYSNDPARAIGDVSSGHLFGYLGLMYEQWFPLELQAGRPLLLVAWNAADIADPQVAVHSVGLEPIQTGTLTRDGVPIRRYFYRVVGSYH